MTLACLLTCTPSYISTRSFKPSLGSMRSSTDSKEGLRKQSQDVPYNVED